MVEKEEIIPQVLIEEPQVVSIIDLDKESDDFDEEFFEYLQDEFQDELVQKIFDDVCDYVLNQAIPMCEFLTFEDVEEIIDALV